MWLNPNRAPPTFQQGSWPIDGIFTAPQWLVMAAGGYLSFGDTIPSDHWAIWLDLHMPEICPLDQEGYIKPQVHRLQCKDPRVMACYNNTLFDILEINSIPQQINQLNDRLLKATDLWQSLCKEHNAINQVVMDAKQGAKNQSQKLKCGQVQWCPWVMAAMNRILFWKSMLKWELGSKVGLLILHKQALKAGLDAVPYPGEYLISTWRILFPKLINSSVT